MALSEVWLTGVGGRHISRVRSDGHPTNVPIYGVEMGTIIFLLFKIPQLNKESAINLNMKM